MFMFILFYSCAELIQPGRRDEERKRQLSAPLSPSPWEKRQRIARRFSSSRCCPSRAPTFQHILFLLPLLLSPQDLNPFLRLLEIEEKNQGSSVSFPEEKEDHAALLYFATSSCCSPPLCPILPDTVRLTSIDHPISKNASILLSKLRPHID